MKNILQDESYTGVLLCHRQEFKNGRRTRYVPESEQFRHDGYYPAVVAREDWERVQALLQQSPKKQAAGNRPCHRYAGLLVCQDCGGPFVAINREWNGNHRVEYICRTYMRHGKAVCPSHRIHEEVLDGLMWDRLTACRDVAAREQQKLKEYQKRLALRKPVLDARRLFLYQRIQKLELEVDEILMEKNRSGKE